MPSGVHDSALLVNAFRARKAHVSVDQFAELWVSEEVNCWADKYVQQVGVTEVLVHALRHRFFLEQLMRFFEQAPDGVFVNIGAGFTNYPYLIASHIPCCEIDSPMNVVFKQQRLAELEAEGKLPPRSIQFMTVSDLHNLAEISRLQAELKEWIGDRPSFILFEGVFFYLAIDTIHALYEMLTTIQKQNDLIASTSFRPEEINKIMFQQLVDYCQTDFNMQNFLPTTVATSFYEQRPGYALVTHENYYNLSRQFAPEEVLQNLEEVLEEDAYILKRL
jgi:O-methyltransferase involved in polyketide biosynthesis